MAIRWDDSNKAWLKEALEVRRLTHAEAAAEKGTSLPSILRAAHRFGFKANRLGRRPMARDDMMQKVDRRLSDGATFREVAADTGMSPAALQRAFYRWRSRVGRPVQTREERASRRDGMLAEAHRLHAGGLRWEEVARRMGTSSGAISKAVGLWRRRQTARGRGGGSRGGPAHASV